MSRDRTLAGMNHSEILTAAAALITTETWCTGCAAARADGYGVDPNDRWAAHWCLLGACCKILDLVRLHQLPQDLLGYIGDGIWATDVGWDYDHDPTPSVHTAAIDAWNDGQSSFEIVRDALLTAVEYAKQDEGHG